MYNITWRLSDGVDAKLAYIAQAPWDDKNLLSSSEAAYHHYAKHCYGQKAAFEITKIINQNEAYATNASECVYTPRPTGKDRSADIEKAVKQLAILDQAISETTNQAWAERLKKLRCRIQAVHSFCILDERVETMEEEEKHKEFTVFIKNFINRIDDISTLGNLFSVENRYVQEWYGTTSKCSTALQTNEGMRVLMISPPTSIAACNAADFKAIVLPGTPEKEVKVSLFYRAAGESRWNEIAMERRVKQIFGIRVKAARLPNGIIEYCVRAADGEAVAYYPATAPALCMAISKEKGEEMKPLKAPVLDAEADGRLRWQPCDKEMEREVHWYRIYRGVHPDFAVGPQTLVTYVYRDTLTYLDVSPGFDGKHLQGTYYYKVSSMDRELCESEPSAPVCCHRMQSLFTPVKRGSEEGIDTIFLGRIELSAQKYLWINYGASGFVTVEIWIDRTQESKGTMIGTTALCATGGGFVQEMGEIPFRLKSTGLHDVYLDLIPSAKSTWEIKSFCMETCRLREPVIKTDADAFALDAGGSELHLFANENKLFQVKTLDGAFSELVRIEENGILSAESPEPVRVVATSNNGIIKERLISVRTPVPEEKPVSFDDFWLISKLIGCGESVLAGGLISGFEYTCHVRQNQRLLYTPSRTLEGSFHIPASILSAGNTYDIAVTALHQEGYEREIVHTIAVTDEGLYPLTDKSLLMVDEESGSCVHTDDWGTQMKGQFEIAGDGLHLSVVPGSASARFTVCLPKPYTKEMPYLLIRASTVSGDWNMQFNGVPVVGPKENGIAVRKDMRIFGFEEGDQMTLSLFVLADQDSQSAETIFHSIQLLPCK